MKGGRIRKGPITPILLPPQDLLILTIVRLVAMDAGQGTVLLLFQRGETTAGLRMPGGWIPPHDGRGPVHLAFAIAADAVTEWVAHLEAYGVAIESVVRWDRGGQSVYFRDPAGHSVELATPGVWAVY